MSYLLLFLGLEHTENTIDGSSGIDRVQSTHHQMSGFGSAQCNLYRGAVAHFADEDDLGSLTERGAQTAGEVIEIGAELPLIDRRFLLRVNELHWILESND